MKLFALVAAAGVVVVSSMMPTAADAQRHGHGQQRWKWKTVCKTTFSHGHKHRECRRTRVRW